MLETLKNLGDPLLFSIVVKDGQKSETVKRRTYKRQFEEIFGDCEPLMSDPSVADVKFNYFAEHVWAYDTACGQAP